MEKARIGCFERTGCLITMLATQEHDAKIKPQGMKVGKFKVPNMHKNDQQVAQEEVYVPEPKSAEEAALEEEENNMKETQMIDDGTLFLDSDDSDDGDEIDDNPDNVE